MAKHIKEGLAEEVLAQALEGQGFIIGIDPGLTGAIAVLNDKGELLLVADIPVCPIPGNKQGKSWVDGKGLYELLSPFAKRGHAWIEMVGASARRGPGRQGTVSAASLGDSRGAIRGCLEAMGVPVDWVRPEVWKKRMALTGLGDDAKHASRMLASRYWGQDMFMRVKDHDRAEAALIALYGYRQEHEPVPTMTRPRSGGDAPGWLE